MLFEAGPSRKLHCVNAESREDKQGDSDFVTQLKTSREVPPTQLTALVNTPRVGQIDHDLDHLDPYLPFRHGAQDLHSTYPTQEARARSCRLHGSHPATGARPHRSYISGIYLT